MDQSDIVNNLDNYFLISKDIIIFSFLFLVSIILLLIFFYKLFLKKQEIINSFKNALDNNYNSIVVTDINRNFIYVNSLFEEKTGYKLEELKGKNTALLKSNQEDNSIHFEINKKLQEGKKWEGELISRNKDNSIIYEKVSIIPIYSNHKVINYLALKTDITKYIEQNFKLQQSSTVFEYIDEAIFITDRHNRITSVNQALLDLSKYSRENLINKTPDIFKSNRHNEMFYKNMIKTILKDGVWKGKVYNKYNYNIVTPAWTTIKALYDKNQKITGYITIQADLREIEDAQKRSKYLKYNDGLTGLPNKLSLNIKLKDTINKSKKFNEEFAILFIDIDRLKSINDYFGHNIGDEVLKIVASRFAKAIDYKNVLFRWTDDSFIIVLENLKNQNYPAIVAQNVMDSLKKVLNINLNQIDVTISIGIALYPCDGEDKDLIIKNAYDIMNYTKRNTLNSSYQYYKQELSVASHRQLEIRNALKTALQKNEFYLLFQPQYDLKKKTIIGAESLIRWDNENIGFTSPNEFIPIAEESLDIISIGEFVFEESCKAFISIQEAGLKLDNISVNVSTLQFSDTLLDIFLNILDKYNLVTSNIEIEITERYFMNNVDKGLELLNSFKNKGFNISIDDFGTGYSSMNYLSKMPLYAIKIDKSFIDDITTSIRSKKIVKSIILIANELGYKTIAEGIENIEQEKLLQKLGCDIGQGYYFSKPITINEIVDKFK